MVLDSSRMRMYVRYRLFEYAEFFAYLDECGDTLVELALVMCS